MPGKLSFDGMDDSITIVARCVICRTVLCKMCLQNMKDAFAAHASWVTHVDYPGKRTRSSPTPSGQKQQRNLRSEKCTTDIEHARLAGGFELWHAHFALQVVDERFAFDLLCAFRKSRLKSEKSILSAVCAWYHPNCGMHTSRCRMLMNDAYSIIQKK